MRKHLFAWIKILLNGISYQAEFDLISGKFKYYRGTFALIIDKFGYYHGGFALISAISGYYQGKSTRKSMFMFLSGVEV